MEEGEEPVRRSKKLNRPNAARWQDHRTQESSSPSLGTVALYEPQSYYHSAPSHIPVGLGTLRKAPNQHLPGGTEGSCVPPTLSLLFMGGGRERQPTELQPPGADLLVFQPGTSWEYLSRHTPDSAYPFLTPTHSVCLHRHPGNGGEAAGHGTTVFYHSGFRSKAAPPQPCVLIPQAPAPPI